MSKHRTSSYCKDLKQGFLLTLPNSNNGVIFSHRKKYVKVLTNNIWDQYMNLKVHKCRNCNRWYVYYNSKELFISLIDDHKPTFCTYIKCKKCIDAGHDMPCDEYRISLNIQKVINRAY